MQSYELILLFDPVLGEEKINGWSAKIEDKIKSLGGEIEKVEKWGSKKLGSPIQRPKKLVQAYYLLVVFRGAPALPVQLQRHLKVTEDIIRYSLCRAVPLQATMPVGKPVATEGEIAAVHVGEIKDLEAGTENQGGESGQS